MKNENKKETEENSYTKKAKKLIPSLIHLTRKILHLISNLNMDKKEKKLIDFKVNESKENPYFIKSIFEELISFNNNSNTNNKTFIDFFSFLYLKREFNELFSLFYSNIRENILINKQRNEISYYNSLQKMAYTASSTSNSNSINPILLQIFHCFIEIEVIELIKIKKNIDLGSSLLNYTENNCLEKLELENKNLNIFESLLKKYIENREVYFHCFNLSKTEILKTIKTVSYLSSNPPPTTQIEGDNSAFMTMTGNMNLLSLESQAYKKLSSILLFYWEVFYDIVVAEDFAINELRLEVYVVVESIMKKLLSKDERKDWKEVGEEGLVHAGVEAEKEAEIKDFLIRILSHLPSIFQYNLQSKFNLRKEELSRISKFSKSLIKEIRMFKTEESSMKNENNRRSSIKKEENQSKRKENEISPTINNSKKEEKMKVREDRNVRNTVNGNRIIPGLKSKINENININQAKTNKKTGSTSNSNFNEDELDVILKDIDSIYSNKEKNNNSSLNINHLYKNFNEENQLKYNILRNEETGLQGLTSSNYSNKMSIPSQFPKFEKVKDSINQQPSPSTITNPSAINELEKPEIREFSLKLKFFQLLKKYFTIVRKERKENREEEKKERKMREYYQRILKAKAFSIVYFVLQKKTELEFLGKKMKFATTLNKKSKFFELCFKAINSKFTLNCALLKKQHQLKSRIMCFFKLNFNVCSRKHMERFELYKKNYYSVKFLILLKSVFLICKGVEDDESSGRINLLALTPYSNQTMSISTPQSASNISNNSNFSISVKKLKKGFISDLRESKEIGSITEYSNPTTIVNRSKSCLQPEFTTKSNKVSIFSLPRKRHLFNHLRELDSTYYMFQTNQIISSFFSKLKEEAYLTRMKENAFLNTSLNREFVFFVFSSLKRRKEALLDIMKSQKLFFNVFLIKTLSLRLSKIKSARLTSSI